MLHDAAGVPQPACGHVIAVVRPLLRPSSIPVVAVGIGCPVLPGILHTLRRLGRVSAPPFLTPRRATLDGAAQACTGRTQPSPARPSPTSAWMRTQIHGRAEALHLHERQREECGRGVCLRWLKLVHAAPPPTSSFRHRVSDFFTRLQGLGRRKD